MFLSGDPADDALSSYSSSLGGVSLSEGNLARLRGDRRVLSLRRDTRLCSIGSNVGPATWSLRPTKHSPASATSDAADRPNPGPLRRATRREVFLANRPHMGTQASRILRLSRVRGHRSEIARRAGSSSPRRSHRRPGLQLGPALISLIVSLRVVGPLQLRADDTRWPAILNGH
jgi:hypothetical protein